jgi:predicted permease
MHQERSGKEVFVTESGDGARRRRTFRFVRSDPATEVEAELEFHLAMRVADLVRDGVPESEARARVAREFGDVGRIRGELNKIARRRERRRRRTQRWDSLWQDVRCGMRALWRRPGTSLLAVATVAVGIGASVMIYSAGRKLIAEALPFPEHSRVVTVERIREDGRGLVERYEDFVAWRSAVDATIDLHAYAETTSFVSDGAQTFRVAAAAITRGAFETLGIAPLRGRTFSLDDADAAVAVITQRLWETRFGGAQDIVGRTLRIDGRIHTVIGVLPRGKQYPVWIDLWTPLETAGAASAPVSVIGRLRDEATAREVQAALTSVQRALDASRPAEERTSRVDVGALDARPGAQTMIALVLLQCAVLVLLLIASTGAAGLTLTRGIERRREIALRTSLGASRGRIVRQLLVESALLAAAAATLGLLVAHGGITLLKNGLPAAMTRAMLGWERLGLDGRAVLVALGLATASGIVFGLFPALRAVRGDLGVQLREGAPTATRGRRGSRAARVLLSGEVALALTLLLSGALLTRSLLALLRTDPGFDADGVLTVAWALPPDRYEGLETYARFHGPVLERITAIAGVHSADIVSNLPMSRTGWSGAYHASTGYLRTLGIPLLSGRHFTPADEAGGTRVAIVSETLARRDWPDVEDVVGRRIDRNGASWTIVGVAGDVHHFGVERAAIPTIYVPQALAPTEAGFLVVRTGGDPASFAPRVRAAIRSVDPDAAIGDAVTLTQLVRDFYADARAMALLMLVFASISTVITIVSLYALVAHAVVRRRREIGIRLTLGARPRQVLLDAMSQGVAWVALGMLAGLALAAGVARLLAAGLYGIRPLDPAVFALVPAALLAVACLASYLPARRATAVDPIETLRGG